MKIHEGDFEAIEYQAFSVRRSANHASTRPDERKVVDDLRATEAELRQQQHLVIQDMSRPWIWLFDSFRLSLDVDCMAPADLSFCPCAFAVDSSVVAPSEVLGAEEDGFEKLHAEPYPRVKYFMTVSVPNP